ncbi:MAG: dicarboxylate/amino acid:cation symporter [Ruminococcaceae bacterium]|nr:dicarboxylate/amino acid:cation symporter [Oscillospiraceae bacterium]
MNKNAKKLSLTWQITIGLVLGIILGLLLQNHADIAVSYIKPIGTVYLNLIKMVVVPVVLLSIMQGIISLQDIRRVGSIGIKTVVYYTLTTALAVTVGLIFANVLNVGAGYILPVGELTYQASEAPSFIDTLVNIFPSNAFAPLVSATMLQVIVIAVFFGFGVILAGEKGKLAADIIDSFAEVSFRVMNLIIGMSSIGVFALITPVVASNGPAVLLPLLKVVLVAYTGYIVHILIVYSASVKVIGGMSPIRFFREMSRSMLFAFSSASSVGVLPFNLEATGKLGVRREISSFVLPLGATINMDGTAIYQGVCAIFIAQIFGIELIFAQQISIILTATLASIGTAGVPGSGMIMLAMVLQSVGLPLEGIALVAGIDRILDMGRTVVNITGDASCAVCVNAMEERREAHRAKKAAETPADHQP